MKTCSIPGCSKKRFARGWCSMHYARWRQHGDPAINLKQRPLADRFWEKVDTSGDCWIWTATRFENGYGCIEDRDENGVRHRKLAHRVAYELARGPIPEGLVIDHLCRNRACVNPDHLEPVTQRVNLLRGCGPTAIKARQTHCIHGHPFNESNTIIRPNGTRKCRECKRQREQRRYQRIRQSQGKG